MFTKTHQITDVFFDLDHTLWDFDRNSALAFETVFKKHGISLALDTFLPVYEPINELYWKKYREEQITKQELRRGRLQDAFATFQQQYPTDVLDYLADDYIIHLPDHNYLFDHTKEILEYLKPKYKLHIITNGFEEVQHRKLEKSGIAPYFDTVTNSERVGVKKPNPLIFNAALKQAKALSNQSVMIGDNLEADILGAENVGMHTIFFSYKANHQHNGRATVNSLDAIRNIL